MNLGIRSCRATSPHNNQLGRELRLLFGKVIKKTWPLVDPRVRPGLSEASPHPTPSLEYRFYLPFPLPKSAPRT